jgi:predicted PurR-regulated permease PerM
LAVGAKRRETQRVITHHDEGMMQNQQRLFMIGFFAALLFLLYQIALVFKPFVLPVLWAVILAHLTFPLHHRLTRWVHGRETVSAGLLTAAIMALGVVPVGLVSAMLVREAGAAYASVEAWIHSDGIKQLPEELAKLPLGGLMHEAIGWVIVNQDEVERFLLESAKALQGFAVKEIATLATNAFRLILNFLVMLFALFFFFKDGASLMDGLYRVVPMEEDHKRQIFLRLDQTIRAVVKGVLVTAVVQGVLAGLAYWLLKAPFPVALMALTTVLAPLPFGGTALIWAPVALYLYWVGPVWKAVAMLVWGVAVVSMVDSVLKPLLIGKGAALPVLFLFFSILGGLAAYGMIGLFLGPILLSLVMAAIQIYREEYLTQPASARSNP